MRLAKPPVKGNDSQIGRRRANPIADNGSALRAVERGVRASISPDRPSPLAATKQSCPARGPTHLCTGEHARHEGQYQTLRWWSDCLTSLDHLLRPHSANLAWRRTTGGAHRGSGGNEPLVLLLGEQRVGVRERAGVMNERSVNTTTPSERAYGPTSQLQSFPQSAAAQVPRQSRGLRREIIGDPGQTRAICCKSSLGFGARRASDCRRRSRPPPLAGSQSVRHVGRPHSISPSRVHSCKASPDIRR
jgi:hypothetical protein